MPDVKRPPSSYLRENFWFTSQPIDEPDDPKHLRDVFEWIGWDKVLFATDYPHWDFDDPRYAVKFQMSEEEKRMFFQDNGRIAYGMA